jgi:hypothetical protein
MESEKFIASNAANDGGKVSSRFEIGNNLALNINLPASTGGGVVCGNNIKETGETCDGTDLGSATCASVMGTGYTGTLSCDTGCTSFNTNACTYQIPTNGLVGYWKFDEGSGTTATDSSGNNNTGTLLNGPIWTTGKVGSALSFDGMDDYVNCGNVNFAGGDYSIEGWFKTTGTSDHDILAATDPASNNSHGILIEIDSANHKLRFLHRSPSGTSGGQELYSLNVVNDGEWHHFVAIKSSSTMYLYLDGVLQQSTTPSGTLPALDIVLGRLGKTLNQRYFNGLIDEVAIYNRALSTSEISVIYNAQK